MNQKVFTKNHTQIAKGFALILMFFDHLFWMDYGKYKSIFPLLPDGHSLEWAIGSIGNICVAMFLFLSGYGMFFIVRKKDQYSVRDALIRIRNIWVDYAIISAVFIIIDLIFGKISFNPIKIILNILALDYSYNKFAWFVITYIVIMLVFPICHKIMKKLMWHFELILIVTIKLSITGIDLLIDKYFNLPHNVYQVLIEPFMFLPVFLLGYFCLEHKVFERLYEIISRIRLKKAILGLAIIIVMIFIYYYQYTVLDNITAPILCFCVGYLANNNLLGKVLKFFGDKSSYMWLIHYPIMVLLLNSLIYKPKYSILIFAVFVVIVYLASLLFEIVLKPIKKWVNR